LLLGPWKTCRSIKKLVENYWQLLACRLLTKQLRSHI
jgi:hypothetical protein